VIGSLLPFIVFAILCLGMLIYAAMTGMVLSSGGWAHLQKEPFLFWLGIAGALAGLAASVVALTWF
jgi:hypothetical protein